MNKLVTIFFFFLIGQAQSQELYIIDNKYPVHDLMPDLSILEDPEGSLTFKDLLNDTSLNFQPRSNFGRYLNIGFTYWGKIDLLTKDSLKGWSLNFEDKMIGRPAWIKSNGKVDVYGFIDNELVFHEKTGVQYPSSERSTSSHWVLNQIDLGSLPMDQIISVLIKVKGNDIGYPAYFNLSVRRPDKANYHQIYQFNNSFNIFMFGVTFIIFLYHILQFFYLREKVMLWFSVWLLFIMLIQAMTVGLIIGSLTNFRYSLFIIITNGVFYSFWFFGRSFIESKEKFPRLDKMMIGLASFVLLESLFVSIYVPIFNVQPFFTGVGIHFYILFIYCLLSIVLSFVLILQKENFAKYFGLGSMIATIFLLIGTLWSMGFINAISSFVDPYSTGMFLQIIIYSFGKAYRRQVIQNQISEERIAAQVTKGEMERIKDLDEVKTRFFTNISHEFRTPLTLILGPLKKALLNSDSKDETVTINKKDFNIIKKNSIRLQHLIDQLLDISKIESGQVYLSLNQGGIIRFIRSLIFSFENISKLDNISINTSFPNENDDAYFDKDKLEKIITNLLSNAFKYTPKNGSINFSVEYNSDYLYLEITDTGKGINKDDLKRIFDRFYRVEGTREKGSGIGLALTKESIDLLNGKISVDSIKNIGTTFKIKLPISLKKLPQSISVGKSFKDQSEQPFKEKFTESISLLSHKSYPQSEDHPLALIVEDNPDLQYFIGEVLMDTYSILIAENGVEGERLAFEHTPDIIITDIMMPKKDGYELCHSLKSDSKTSHIPIIMLTAKAGTANRIGGLTKGADAYLTKPFNEKELLIRMKNLIETRKHFWEHFKTLDMLLVDDIDVSSIDDRFLQDVFQTIKQNIGNEKFGVENIARAVGFSRSQLHRKLKALSGKSANQLITEMRLNKAHKMLKSKIGSVSEIAYAVGYSNLSYFAKSFKEKFGSLPSKV